MSASTSDSFSWARGEASGGTEQGRDGVGGTPQAARAAASTATIEGSMAAWAKQMAEPGTWPRYELRLTRFRVSSGKVSSIANG